MKVRRKGLPSPNFHPGKSYLVKMSAYFLAMCANLPCKIEKFELEAVGVGILGTGFFFNSKQPLTYLIEENSS